MAQSKKILGSSKESRSGETRELAGRKSRDGGNKFVSNVLTDSEESRLHKERVEKALEDGARGRKGRFRL